jgi:hypothetical protein
MPSIHIILDGDGAFPEMKQAMIDGTLIEIDPNVEMKIAALPGGMQSGNPSVALCIPLPDGRLVYAQMSLRMLLFAADAFKARHGDPRTGQPGFGTKGGVG